MKHFVLHFTWIVLYLFESATSDDHDRDHLKYPHEPERFHFDECPSGAEIISSRQGLPQKCLPRQLQICYDAANITLPAKLTDKPICCWHNKVDYYCCRGVAPENCPRYNDVTVVIRKGVPRPAPQRLYAFRKIVPLFRSPFAAENHVARQPLAPGFPQRVVGPPLPFHRRLTSRGDPLPQGQWGNPRMSDFRRRFART